MCRSSQATPNGEIIIALFTSVLFYSAGAASPSEMTLAQAVKQEAEVLHREVQGMIEEKRFDAAITALQERGSKWVRQYGAKSWPMAEVSSMLAETFLACGSVCDKEDEAAELYEKSAEVKREIYGDRAPEYAAAIETAADAFVKVGSYRRALSYLKKLAKAVSAGLGQTHEATRNVWKKLGDCAMRTKSYKSAQNAFSKLLHSNLAPEDEAHARLQLAVALTHLSKSKAALEHIEAAKLLVARHFGKKDMRYAKVLNGAAGVLERLNNHADALHNMQEASEIVAEVLGPKDPMALQAKRNVEGLSIAIRSKSSERQSMTELL